MTSLDQQVRVTALALLQRPDGKVLLESGVDTVKNETFYRPLGGGVEFGETGSEALSREFKEEIGKEIIVEHFLSTIENIFEYQGMPGHEILLIYKCRFCNAEEYEHEHFDRTDEVAGHTFWKSRNDIVEGGVILYPKQFINLVKDL